MAKYCLFEQKTGVANKNNNKMLKSLLVGNVHAVSDPSDYTDVTLILTLGVSIVGLVEGMDVESTNVLSEAAQQEV